MLITPVLCSISLIISIRLSNICGHWRIHLDETKFTVCFLSTYMYTSSLEERIKISSIHCRTPSAHSILERCIHNPRDTLLAYVGIVATKHSILLS